MESKREEEARDGWKEGRRIGRGVTHIAEPGVFIEESVLIGEPLGERQHCTGTLLLVLHLPNPPFSSSFASSCYLIHPFLRLLLFLSSPLISHIPDILWPQPCNPSSSFKAPTLLRPLLVSPPLMPSFFLFPLPPPTFSLHPLLVSSHSDVCPHWSRLFFFSPSPSVTSFLSHSFLFQAFSVCVTPSGGQVTELKLTYCWAGVTTYSPMILPDVLFKVRNNFPRCMTVLLLLFFTFHTSPKPKYPISV